MEIEHGSHEHPLVFTDKESDDNEDDPVVCWGCEDAICGPRFSCFPCNFHLHKSCTQLPPRLLDHPLHPQHPLSLLPRPSYASKSYRCDACKGDGKGFVYNCFQCHYDLHITCALSHNHKSDPVLESTNEEDSFLYGLHQHLLVLEEKLCAPLETNNGFCFGCLDSISAPFFSCSRPRCKFWIHRDCANLPQEIKGSFPHPRHTLVLFRSVKNWSCDCAMCGQPGKLFYVCFECDFFIHPKCAFSNPRDAMKRLGEKHIQHRSHSHNLTLLEGEQEWASIQNDDPLCRLCRLELASSPRYGCELCPFFLHKSCAEFPGQINSRLHLKHPLFLFAKCESTRATLLARSLLCACCAIEVGSLYYNCIQCGFILHYDCFLSLDDLELSRFNHHHSFVDIKRFKKLACDACGEEAYFSPWQCTLCHLMVHKKCAEFSRFVKVGRHSHVLTLTYFLRFVHECDNLICQLCYKQVSIDYAAYYCRQCRYVAHLHCAQMAGVVVLEEEMQDNSTLQSFDERSHSLIGNSAAISLLEDASKGSEIQPLTHQHNWILNEKDLEDQKYCEACVTLTSSPFYSCKDCDFYMHKLCAEMPKAETFSFHPHLLHLNLVEEIEFCQKCGKDYNGFMYSCQIQDCLFTIDFHCVKLMMEGLDHPCHEHTLFFPDPKVRNYENCKGCGTDSNYILVCSKCEYVLGYCCAKLPHKVNHRYDDHLLSLAFKNEDEYGEYYCDICENERDPKDWFYCCTKCDFYAHMNCALTNFPYIKFGSTFGFEFHDHPLIYVEHPKSKPPPRCLGCGKHCYSRLLECIKCSFAVHFSSSCIENVTKDSDLGSE